MADRAAIVTGASSGIGLAIARVLGQEGYSLTLAARRPEKLAGGRGGARRGGLSSCRPSPRTSPRRPTSSAWSMPTASATGGWTCSSTTPASGSARPWARSRPSAWTCSWTSTCARSSCSTANRWRCSGRPPPSTRNALVVNTSSISGKRGVGWTSVYSATKHGVVGFTEAMNKELSGEGIKSTALCPAFVDTPMTDFVKESRPRRADDPARGRRRVRALPAQALPHVRGPGDHVPATRRGRVGRGCVG